MKQEKKKPGRPRLDLGPTVPLQVRLTPEQHAWITSQAEGASEIVRRWINDAMSKEQK